LSLAFHSSARFSLLYGDLTAETGIINQKLVQNATQRHHKKFAAETYKHATIE
jgi:hypothetical protein